MKLSSRDLQSIAITSVGGLVISGLYGLLNVVIDKKMISLSIPTSFVIQHDRQLAMLLSALEKKLADIDPVLMSKIVLACDSVLECRSKIKESNTEAQNVEQQVRAFMFLNLVDDQVEQMLKTATEKNLTGHVYANSENLFKNVKVRLETHYANILAHVNRTSPPKTTPRRTTTSTSTTAT